MRSLWQDGTKRRILPRCYIQNTCVPGRVTLHLGDVRLPSATIIAVVVEIVADPPHPLRWFGFPQRMMLEISFALQIHADDVLEG